MHPAFAEQFMRLGTRAEQEHVRVFAQLRQRRDQQLGAFAAADAAGHDEAQATARGSRRHCWRCHRPRCDPVRNHMCAQIAQFRGESELVRERCTTRCDQCRLRRAQCADGFVAERAPMVRIAVRELSVGAGEIARALRVVEAMRGIAEIAMQRRPQRIVVVHDPVQRQASAQSVEAVPDQRGDDNRIDTIGVDNALEQVAVAGVTDCGVGNRARQRETSQRRSGQRAVAELQPFTRPPPRKTAARN